MFYLCSKLLLPHESLSPLSDMRGALLCFTVDVYSTRNAHTHTSCLERAMADASTYTFLCTVTYIPKRNGLIFLSVMTNTCILRI